ncbi:unnamed protein product [Trichogramma brassicae]|uniref:Uncharacterized protein n=1 Tax=Trichogramma brassicae TaxID=86971 RepID=A0A6H5INY0_9HYME|nr:unnamed protein product [Trichogramma brassicae]
MARTRTHRGEVELLQIMARRGGEWAEIGSGTTLMSNPRHVSCNLCSAATAQARVYIRKQTNIGYRSCDARADVARPSIYLYLCLSWRDDRHNNRFRIRIHVIEKKKKRAYIPSRRRSSIPKEAEREREVNVSREGRPRMMPMMTKMIGKSPGWGVKKQQQQIEKRHAVKYDCSSAAKNQSACERPPSKNRSQLPIYKHSVSIEYI